MLYGLTPPLQLNASGASVPSVVPVPAILGALYVTPGTWSSAHCTSCWSVAPFGQTSAKSMSSGGTHSAAYASVPEQTISIDFGKPDGRKRRTFPVKRVTLLPAPAVTVMSSSSLPVDGLVVTKTEQLGQPASAETSP